MAKIPLGGNVYPMPSAAFLEDSALRMSLLSHSAMGVASLEEGWLETVLDRRLMRDDNRGLGQGVTDNKRTLLQVRARAVTAWFALLVPVLPEGLYWAYSPDYVHSTPTYTHSNRHTQSLSLSLC
jgi:hypothetical protein